MKPKALMAKLLLAAATAAAMAAHAIDVSYIDPTEPGSQSKTAACTQYNGQDTLTSGWYVVEGDVFNGSRIFVKGDVNLILKDNAELTVGAGIIVDVNNNVTNSLTIWAQSDGASMGKLTAKGRNYSAGIGGGNGGACGTVTVNGGEVTATGDNGGAGIGGGSNGACGTVTVNGGEVTATGNRGSAGIGGGMSKAGGTVTVSGGKVTAQGGGGGRGRGKRHADRRFAVHGAEGRHRFTRREELRACRQGVRGGRHRADGVRGRVRRRRAHHRRRHERGRGAGAAVFVLFVPIRHAPAVHERVR